MDSAIVCQILNGKYQIEIPVIAFEGLSLVDSGLTPGDTDQLQFVRGKQISALDAARIFYPQKLSLLKRLFISIFLKNNTWCPKIDWQGSL